MDGGGQGDARTLKAEASAEIKRRLASLELLPRLTDRYDTHKGRMLGNGAYGAVYAAEIKDDTAQTVALKVVRLTALARKEPQEALCTFREIAMLDFVSTALPPEHRELVTQLVEARRTQNNILISMQLCAGQDLFYRIAECAGGLEEAHIAWILRDLVVGLAGLHDAGVLHRDIKPENILTENRATGPAPASSSSSGASGPVKGQGPPLRRQMTTSPRDPGFRVRYADFGFAYSPSVFTKDMYEGRFLGTPQYAAPEVVFRGVHSRASDVWSLGTVAFAMCAGAVPFPCRTKAEARRAMEAAGGRVDLSKGAVSVRSSACRDLLSRMLDFDPASRISARDALSHPFLRDSASAGTNGAEEALSRLRAFNNRRRWRRAGFACIVGSGLARARRQTLEAEAGKEEMPAPGSVGGEATGSQAKTGQEESEESEDADTADALGVSMSSGTAGRAGLLALPSAGSATSGHVAPGSSVRSVAGAIDPAALQAAFRSEARALNGPGASFLTTDQCRGLLGRLLVRPASSASVGGAPCDASSGDAAEPAAGMDVALRDAALDRLCRAFDVDGDGTVDALEFVAGIARLRGTRTSALALLFDLVDSDGDGRLSAREIARVLSAQAGPEQAVEAAKARAAAAFLERADADQDGLVSLAELRDALRTDHVMAAAFLGTGPPVPVDEADAARGADEEEATGRGGKRARPEAARPRAKRAKSAGEEGDGKACAVM